MKICDDLKRMVAKQKDKPATISVRLFNNQAYLIQVKSFEDDFLDAKVSNNFSRRIAYSAIAEYWDVSDSEAHPFKDTEPREA